MDRDDIIKFRKTCETLLSSKQMTRKSIASEIGLSEPSVVKVLTVPLQDMRGLHASTLGAIQDFNKKHRGQVEMTFYESPEINESDPVTSKQTQKELALESARQNTFWTLINEAARCVPDNIKVIISIKSRNI